MNTTQRQQHIFGFLVLCIILCVPLFYGLGDMTLRMWDESRLAENALQMYHDKDFLVTKFNHEPDMWNTKPPLFIWLQVLSFHIFGINEFALRFPAAVAGFATCMLLFWFCKNKLNNYALGIVAALVLISSRGFVDIHVTRTGDYDALLILFTTAMVLFFFLYTETQKSKWLYYSLLAASLAVLTKGVAGLLFAPALLIYIIWKRQLLSLLKNKHFYLSILLFALPVFTYYYLREQANPGYFSTVLDNEVGGRYLTAKEGNSKRWSVYLEFFTGRNFTMWFIFLPIAWINAKKQQPIQKNIIIFCTLLIIVFLSIISSAKTKLVWYDAPIFPLAAIVSAIGIAILYNWAKQKNKLSFNTVKGFLILLFSVAYVLVNYYAFTSGERNLDPESYNNSDYLKNYFFKQQELKSINIVNESYAPNLNFYREMGIYKGFDLKMKDKAQLQSGDVIITQQKKIMDYIATHYTTDTLTEKDGIQILKIK